MRLRTINYFVARARNPYKDMRGQIMGMQRAFARMDEISKRDKDVQDAITSLYRMRVALESLWARSIT